MAEAKKAVIADINIDRIWPNPDQPRKESWGDIEGLKTTMEEQGLVQYPVVIRKDQPKGQGHFMLISGERRWRAAKRSNGKIRKLTCIIRHDIKEKDIFELSIMENLQRQALNPIEDAKSWKRLMEEKCWSVPELAKRIGTSAQQVYNRLKLLELPPEIQTLVAQRKISPVNVSGLHSVPDPKTKIQIAKKIVDKKLNNKAAQALILETMAKQDAKFSDGRSAKEVEQEHLYSRFSTAVRSLSEIFDSWHKLDNQSRKNFLAKLEQDKALVNDLEYARKLLNEIGEEVD